MSVVTSNNSALSVLKIPKTAYGGLLNKIRFQIPKDIKSLLLEFKSGINKNEYEKLIITIRDAEINDNDLLTMLIEAKNCASLLNYDLRLFVQALLMVPWSHRGDNIVKCYQEFIQNLISAHPCHIKVVIDQLIKLFSYAEDTDCIGSQLTESATKRFNNIHILLKTTLSTVPMSDDILINSIKQNFPYINAASCKQVSYLCNILKIIEYHTDLRLHVLEIAIDKLLIMDIHSPKEEIIQYENHPDFLYEMEVDDVEQKNNERMKHPIADSFDLMMELMFKYVKNCCFVDGKCIKSKCIDLFNDLITIFENVILPTHECHHIQYIMFYICSFEISLANDFLKFLWKNVSLPNISPVIRQTAAGYVSSFLARAEYLNLGFLKNYILKFNEWIHSYIACYDTTSECKADFKQHCVFYSICQAMFYLITFRYQDLVNSSNKLVFLQSLNLTKIISSPLNPLKFCHPTIVDSFAAITRAYQLAYCYTIIENNARETLPLIGKSGQFIVNSVVNMYFPFDPCILLRTCNYINPLYKDIKRAIKQELPNSSFGKKTRLHSGTEDEDDFIKDEILMEGKNVSF